MEHNMQNPQEIADEIIRGRRLKRGEDFSFLLDSPLEDLSAAAGRLQKQFCGNHIDLCTVINGRCGHCSENCRYCAQASCHNTNIEAFGFLPEEEIVANAHANEAAGVNRFAIVTSGRRLAGEDFRKALHCYRRMKRELKHMDLCASHGLLTREQLHKLHEAGVTSYHHNIETSRRFFPQICTTHTYDDRIQTIRWAQAEGFCVCSGGIIGLGETWEDRIDMAVSLA
ncbi:MAG: biotin synthase BioB, partial [Selenomonadaceae bacterium]|nr:biotin synthase BioB [Selenomonadaceae bacterium]